MNKTICVLIRVFNRIHDLELNLEIIKKTWTNNKYYIIISSNGKSSGYHLTKNIYENVDHVLEIENNSGLLKGNSQLLLEGVKNIPNECDYTILLEADTWMFTDSLICKYILMMEQENAVWASAKWYDKYYSNATDFAIVNTSFLLANSSIVDFSILPECWIASYLLKTGQKSIYIKELMPVHVPSYIRKYFYAPQGRFFIFPNGKMVTYHIEYFKKGMDEKKYFFNVISKYRFFETSINKNYKMELIKIKLSISLSYIFLKRSWYSNQKYHLFL